MSISALIIIAGFVSLAWAWHNYKKVDAVSLSGALDGASQRGLVSSSSGGLSEHQFSILKDTYEAISEGAEAFLHAEYKYCAVFCTVFAVIIFSLISWGQNAALGFLTTLSFILGAGTSVASGYIGMKVAVYANVRTTLQAQRFPNEYKECFNTAFRAGSVMGFALSGLGILVMYITLCFYAMFFTVDKWTLMMDAISGFGLGGSTIALFGRVGGGIYTKAADVGADIAGKVLKDLPEDSPLNPATIADNVGDNVGDVAGMGADLFGSFAESTCACLVIAAQTPGLRDAGWSAICFPIAISSIGIFVCIAISFVATDLYPVIEENRIELALRLQLILTTVCMVPAAYLIAGYFLPDTFFIDGVSVSRLATRGDAVICVIYGAIGGLIIGLTTEYYTSKIFQPVKELVGSCEKGGAATNIIYGLALGYKSVVAPVFVLATIIYTAFSLCDMYGVALAAVGMLSNLATGLTIDAYGPVCDNAGGIAEMAELDPKVREKTDALDAAGNTTAAVGKGFAIGSAALVSLALYGAFVVRVQASNKTLDNPVEILQPMTFAFLLIGSMLPYWFSAMTMKSVGEAANEMVEEVKRQFIQYDLKVGSRNRPDYNRCVAISTESALREMVAPGALVLIAPLLTGTFFGVYAVYGLLTGALLSGVQLAISMSNTGGAWDNCKKLIEASGRKGTDIHKAAVVGDTVGDPLKDTSGPALNILMKLMAIISLVFADYFVAINEGRGVFNIATGV